MVIDCIIELWAREVRLSSFTVLGFLVMSGSVFCPILRKSIKSLLLTSLVMGGARIEKRVHPGDYAKWLRYLLHGCNE